jgi:dolichol-phosphate mannosyltransferase
VEDLGVAPLLADRRTDHDAQARRAMSDRCLAVVPTYNEAGYILELVRDVLAQDPSLDVLVVDDGSPDGTADLVAAEMADEPRLGLCRRPAKLGLGSAYLAGFRVALERGYARVVTMDGDGSHRARHLPAMLAAMEDHDMVVGSRYMPGGGIVNWAFHRRLLSAFANGYTRFLLGLPVRDCTGGYRCYSREVLETVDPFRVRSSGYSFLEEMVWRVHAAGFRIAEVPIVFESRHSGRSKIDRVEILKAAWNVLATACFPPHVPRRRTPPAGEPLPEARAEPR